MPPCPPLQWTSEHSAYYSTDTPITTRFSWATRAIPHRRWSTHRLSSPLVHDAGAEAWRLPFHRPIAGSRYHGDIAENVIRSHSEGAKISGHSRATCHCYVYGVVEEHRQREDIGRLT